MNQKIGFVKMRNFAIIAVALATLAGCKINGKALIGAHKMQKKWSDSYCHYNSDGNWHCSEELFNLSSKCSDADLRGKVTSTSKNATGCEVPYAMLAKVEAASDGAVKVSVSKMANGRFPAVTDLAYGYWADDYSYSTVEVGFFCFDGASSPDGLTHEFVCRSSESKRISPISLSSQDRRLWLSKLAIANPECGAARLYTVSEPSRSCRASDQDPASYSVGRATVPDLFMDGAP